ASRCIRPRVRDRYRAILDRRRGKEPPGYFPLRRLRFLAGNDAASDFALQLIELVAIDLEIIVRARRRCRAAAQDGAEQHPHGQRRDSAKGEPEDHRSASRSRSLASCTRSSALSGTTSPLSRRRLAK